tara:strand:+ start:1114 stop:1272 length:159 start_codon:yes stop_codon:yes gene_type:complete
MSNLKNESPQLVATQIKLFGKAICPTEDFFLCEECQKEDESTCLFDIEVNKK